MSREKWREAYRTARIVMKSNPQDYGALCRFDGMQFKAFAVLWYHRDREDILATHAPIRLQQNRIANAIIDELIAEGRL